MSAEQMKWLVLLLGVFVFLLGLYVAHRFRQFLDRRSGAVNQKRGRRAERQAQKLLQREGFQVLDAQPRFKSELLVNGDSVQFEVTPDLLVVKDGVRYAVEVKTYSDSSGVNNASVRRQVIEYLLATGMPCLLVRMPAGDIDLIELPP